MPEYRRAELCVQRLFGTLVGEPCGPSASALRDDPDRVLLILNTDKIGAGIECSQEHFNRDYIDRSVV